MNFRQLKIEDKPLYDRYLSGNETNSESSFANMFAWRNVMDTLISFDEDNCYFVYTKRNGKKACCFPRGANPLSGIKNLQNYFRLNNNEMIMESVTESEAEFIRNHFKKVQIFEDTDLNDYVYYGEKLRTLQGKKLHSKRNHINKFKSMYPDYKCVRINESNIEDCLQFSHRWLIEKWGSKLSKGYTDEMKSISEFLLNFNKLNLSGIVLIYEDDIIAFTLGEKLNADTCVVHVEKANTMYDGAYTMINNLYISEIWPNIKYVNREEDMGIEGIRKAKKSYYPDCMVTKHTIIFEL